MVKLNISTCKEETKEVVLSSIGEFFELIHHLIDIDDGDSVWVLAIEDEDDILCSGYIGISHGLLQISQYLENCHFLGCHKLEEGDTETTFYLQEYKSFEDAYAVALGMREPNPLCYN